MSIWLTVLVITDNYNELTSCQYSVGMNLVPCKSRIPCALEALVHKSSCNFHWLTDFGIPNIKKIWKNLTQTLSRSSTSKNFLPSLCILWSSVSGITNSSWPLLLVVREGLNFSWQLSSDSFCHFMYTSGNKDNIGNPNDINRLRKANGSITCVNLLFLIYLCCKTKDNHWWVHGNRCLS